MTTKVLKENTAYDLDVASIPKSDIIRRALIAALVIGTLLTIVTQSAAVFGSEELKYLRLALAYITPFALVAISQILGIERALIDVRENKGQPIGKEAILTTAFSHGIPTRAVVLGIIAGSVNAVILTANALMDGANLASMPIAALAPAFVLPLFFGQLSQTIAYRRTFKASRCGR